MIFTESTITVEYFRIFYYREQNLYQAKYKFAYF